MIHALNNYESQKKNGSGIYYYIPKLESWQEAKLVGTLLKSLEQAMGLPRGSLKVKVLNERAEFVLQQEVIEWVLRENLIGPNVGRWDYLNSREDMFHHDPDMVIPNPTAVTMIEPSMTALHAAQRAARAARRRDADRRHGGADAEPARAPARRQGAARHLVRQAARAADRALQDRRQAVRHLSPELGGDGQPRVRRGGQGTARDRVRAAPDRRGQD